MTGPSAFFAQSVADRPALTSLPDAPAAGIDGTPSSGEPAPRPAWTIQREIIEVHLRLMLAEALAVHSTFELLNEHTGAVVMRKPASDLHLQVNELLASVAQLQRLIGRRGH